MRCLIIEVIIEVDCFFLMKILAHEFGACGNLKDKYLRCLHSESIKITINVEFIGVLTSLLFRFKLFKFILFVAIKQRLNQQILDVNKKNNLQ